MAGIVKPKVHTAQSHFLNISPIIDMIVYNDYDLLSNHSRFFFVSTAFAGGQTNNFAVKLGPSTYAVQLTLSKEEPN